MMSGVILMRVRLRFLWRMISWPAALGIRWVNPSMATLSPSRMVSSTASARERKRDIEKRPVRKATRYLGGAFRMVKWDGPGRSADHHNQAIRILGQSGFRDKRGAKVACPCYVVVMLDHSTIRKIVHEAVQAHAPPQGVRDVLSEPDIDLDGNDALEITVVLTPE